MLPAVPAYFYPWPRSRDWARLLATAEGVVVLNPATGPGRAPDPRYVEVADRARAGGLELLGYVDSAYGAHTVADLVSQAQRHRDWYGVDGAFVDQTSPARADLRHYASLRERLASRGLTTSLNPGQPLIDRGFADVADALVVFEGVLAEYRVQHFPDWLLTTSGTRQWHLVYEVPHRTALLRATALARERGADLAFFTDGGLPNPWDHLPSYWTSQVRALTSR